MKVLKVAAGLILVLGLTIVLARLAPAFAAPQEVNTIAGSVFRDDNMNGILDEELTGTPDVRLELYRDDNGNGLIDKHDRRLAKTDTGEDGQYTFSIAEAGDFLVKVDTKSLPKASVLTTPNLQAASFKDKDKKDKEYGQTYSDKNFGYADAPHVDDEVLVTFVEGTSKQRIKEILDGHGLKLKQHQERKEGDGFYLLTTPPGEVDAVIEYLASYPDDVAKTERNGIVGGDYTPTDPDYTDDPTDPDYAKSYGLRVIQAETAWDTTKGAASTIVAVVDSGLSMAHPEFVGRVLPGWDFVNGDDNPSDDNGHGTHVAGIIAATMDNDRGLTGVAPGVSIMPVKVLDASNSGTWANLASGIVYAVDQGAKVINLSLGGDSPSSTVYDAVLYAAAHNVLVVAGSGNLPDGDPFYPAAYPEVLAVSATDANDAWWTSSDYGDWVDVSAPGDAVWSTLWTSTDPQVYGAKSGTSMATGFVSGLAALVFSARPELSAPEVQDLIQQTSDDKGYPGRDEFYGWGRINAGAALGSTGARQTPTPVPTATPTPTPFVLRVDAGNTSTTALYTDSLGQVWVADKAFTSGSWGYMGGSAKPPYTTQVGGTENDPLYQKLREGMTEYKFTVPNGPYQVQLRFAEFAASKAGDRVAKIAIQGVGVESGLDVWSAVGKAVALDRSYATMVGDGLLSISFTQLGGRYKPMISAIEIQGGNDSFPAPTPTPMPTATATPTPYVARVNCGSTAYKDKGGLVWAADKAFATGSWGYVGGTTGKSTAAVANTDDDSLYQKYRTKMTEYKFTVPNGTYQVRLRFAELATTTAGARAMKITIEGTAVEEALDVVALAPGKAVALDRTYQQVSVADGVLNIEFARGAGATLYPVISAIEVR